MSKLPLIAKRLVEDKFRDLKANIIMTDFPEGYKSGLYDQALKILNAWDSDQIESDLIFTNKKNPVMIALLTYESDRELIETAQRIKEAAKNAKIPKEKLAEEDEIE